MKVLVDTSIWIEHFKSPNNHLINLLLQDRVLCHPYVIGEIACGTPPAPRASTLSDFRLLSQVRLATLDETLFFIEENRLYGKGCGLIDIALLASTLLTPNTQIWTADKRLQKLAAELKTEYSVE